MSIDPPTLRDRAEHAAKYGANLVVPAREIKDLLDEGGAMLGSIAALNARITELQTNVTARDAALDRARAIHSPVDAIHEPTGRHRQVCTGCGTDAGNWQPWPCPTTRAIDGATLAEGGDPR